jgi:hypothetical protein
MRLTKYIILFTVLILTTLVKSSNAETTCTENSLGDQTCITTTTTTTGVAGVTTENLLSSNFNDGSWTHTNQQFHGDYMLATTGNSTSSSTVSLTDDAGLSKTQINAGFSSTLGADVWFWSGVSSKVTLRQTLTDDNGNVITQYRDITGTSNSRTNYTDTIIVGSNSQQNYNITASIENVTSGYSSSSHIGPDINNPSLIVTTNDTYQTSTTSTETFTYCYDRVPNACTYDNSALDEIKDLKTDDGKSYDEFINEQIKLDDFQVIETSFIIENDLGEIEEIKVEDFAVKSFENFIESNNLTETFETALVEEGLGKEEFFETMTDSIKEEFGDEFKSDDKLETENLTTENETIEASNDTTTETKVEETSNETNTESQTSETVSTESNVDKNTETEGTETKANNEETVDAKTDTDVKTNGGSSIDTRSIEKKVERVIAKVLSKIKEVDKKLQAVQYITTQGIKSGEADISNYINKRIYGNQNLYSSVPFYENLNILEQQQIYKDVSLNTYVSNDPIAVKQRLTVEIESEISRIQAELYALKQKRGS